jgi:hypothetical protein
MGEIGRCGFPKTKNRKFAGTGTSRNHCLYLRCCAGYNKLLELISSFTLQDSIFAFE